MLLVIHVLRVLSVVNERSLLFVVSSSKYFLLERKGRHLLPPVVSCFKAEGRCTVCVCVVSKKLTWGALKAKAAFEALGHSLHNCLVASLGLAAPCWLSGSGSVCNVKAIAE